MSHLVLTFPLISLGFQHVGPASSTQGRGWWCAIQRRRALSRRTLVRKGVKWWRQNGG